MPQRVVDSRTPEGAYATKPNIVPQAPDEGFTAGRGVGSGTLGTDDAPTEIRKVVHDASVANATVLLDDTTGQTADTLPLPAGTYDVYVKIRHPSTAAANRQVQVVVRNNADNGDTRILKSYLADGPTGATRTDKFTGVVVAAKERIVVRTGSDATNTVVSADLAVVRVD